MNPVERLRVRGRGRRERKREREKERLKSQSERAEGTSARGKKDWGRMSILIKVKLSQSLVGIRIESTRDERRAVERRKKRNKNAAAAEVCLSNADRSRRLKAIERLRYFIIITGGGRGGRRGRRGA